MNEFINYNKNNISTGQLDKLELFLMLNKFLTTHWSVHPELLEFSIRMAVSKWY